MKKGCGLIFFFALIVAFLNILPFGCNRVEITEDPVRKLIEQESLEPIFTLLLFDMDKEGIFSKTYKHRYRIIKEKDGKVTGVDTKWYNVPSSYFKQHENSLGMEMAAKDDKGKISRIVGPPGYTNYIGNPKYGYWGNGQINSSATSLADVPLDGVDTSVIKIRRDKVGYHSIKEGYAKENFWHFYPEYANVRTLLDIPAGKIYKEDHKEARSYYNRGFIYYGIMTSGGRRKYGTYSNYYRTNTSRKRWTRGGGGYGK